MNPLLSSQTNRESFAAMIAWGDEENTNSFYEPHLVLQNTSESIGEKEARKVGAESLRQNLKIYLRIFLKKSSNFDQKTQGSNSWNS
ncbi:MAG: hypothetical protein COT09_03135 [Candidatus Hydromicrobium americanum]|nr:MAG: hypothetical protein COT09_03135 [Candidatus Hydromicrobium americanum]